MTNHADMPDSEPFPSETLVADGWEYRDLGRMTNEAWLQLRDIIGVNNIRFLTWAIYENGDERGQVFISPAGLARAIAWRKENAKSLP